jgi:hypothetical protein
VETLIEPESSDSKDKESDEKSSAGGFTEPISPEEPAADVLKKALENETPRLFGISAHGIRGRTGQEEEEAVGQDLKTMREGSEAIGQELGMETIGYVVMYEEDQTIAYRYDSNSNPRDPHLIAAMVNCRMPMRALLKVMGEAT